MSAQANTIHQEYQVPYFKTPNEYIDKWLPILGATAYCILEVINRKTRGWQKEIDRISLSQLEKATGFSRHTIIKGIKKCSQLMLVQVLKTGKKGCEEQFFSLCRNNNSNNSDQCKNYTPPPSAKFAHTKDIFTSSSSFSSSNLFQETNERKKEKEIIRRSFVSPLEEEEKEKPDDFARLWKKIQDLGLDESHQDYLKQEQRGGRAPIKESDLKSWLKKERLEDIEEVLETICTAKVTISYAAYVQHLLDLGIVQKKRNEEINKAYFARIKNRNELNHIDPLLQGVKDTILDRIYRYDEVPDMFTNLIEASKENFLNRKSYKSNYGAQPTIEELKSWLDEALN